MGFYFQPWPQEVVTMNIKDSLKFGVLIGLLEVSSRVTRNKEVVDAVLHLVSALFFSEMEFLDMNLTRAFCEYRDGILGHEFDKKTRESFASMQFTVSSSGGFYRKPLLCSGFKNSSHEHFLLRWNSWT